jgi:60 kDa SS-A/Ro ribonucleoprotein
LASLPNYQSISDLNHIAHLISTAGLSREHLPSQLFKQRRIWEALLTNKGPSGKGKGMPLTALIRNLGKLSTQEIKIIEPRLYRDESPSGKLAYSLSTAPTMTPAFPPGHTQHYTEYIFHRLTNKHDIKYTKIHPYTILVAMLTYKKGCGDKGSLTWVPNVHILDALDHAFKLAFQNLTPTGKRIKIALDVSGSMSAAFCTGSPIVNCATASLAMMLMTLDVERGGAPPLKHTGIQSNISTYRSPQKKNKEGNEFNPDIIRHHHTTAAQHHQSTSPSFTPPPLDNPMSQSVPSPTH